MTRSRSLSPHVPDSTSTVSLKSSRAQTARSTNTLTLSAARLSRTVSTQTASFDARAWARHFSSTVKTIARSRQPRTHFGPDIQSRVSSFPLQSSFRGFGRMYDVKGRDTPVGHRTTEFAHVQSLLPGHYLSARVHQWNTSPYTHRSRRN